ncbi:hypothetical protein OG331_13720 [Streptomyces sp. NBC_01017]|uniref:alpha/beta fold hydrolase n=1 Tax=Streptomyces sp. NBC_01017 TaxID=2903721 RepID=UPI00386DA09E|nr:hypothetical protein OG331_13720 [Streptomyces sp. NBC_01017]
MTSFTLPHELHGEGAHKVCAVHGWFADRSAYAGVLPDLDRTEFTYCLADLRCYGDAKSAVGAYTTAGAALDLVELAGRLSADLLPRTWMTWYPRAELHELTAARLPHSRLRSTSGGTPIRMGEPPLELIRVAEDFLRADGPHEGEQA